MWHSKAFKRNEVLFLNKELSKEVPELWSTEHNKL
jgi:hypothetical protein